MKKTLLRLPWDTFVGWKEDRCHSHGAALAYFALLAIPSFFILVVMILDKAAGQKTIEQQVIPFLNAWLNPHVAALIHYVVGHVSHFGLEQSATFAAIVSTALGVSGFSGQLRTAIRVIWGIPRGEVSPAEFAHEKTWDLLGSLFIGCFSALGIALRIAARRAIGVGPAEPLSPIGTAAELIWSGLYWSLLCAVLYKLLIPSKVRLRHLVPGAALTGFAISFARLLYQYFIPKETAAVPGLLGYLFFTLLALYFFCQVFLVGAEMTRVLSRPAQRPN